MNLVECEMETNISNKLDKLNIRLALSGFRDQHKTGHSTFPMHLIFFISFCKHFEMSFTVDQTHKL